MSAIATRPRLSRKAALEVLEMMREAARSASDSPFVLDGKVDRESLIREAWSGLIGKLEHFAGVDCPQELLPEVLFAAVQGRIDREELAP